MKEYSVLSGLIGYDGKRRYFTYASWLLAAISAFHVDYRLLLKAVAQADMKTMESNPG